MKAFEKWVEKWFEKADKLKLSSEGYEEPVMEETWRAALEEALKHDLDVDCFENSEIVDWIKKELKED